MNQDLLKCALILFLLFAHRANAAYTSEPNPNLNLAQNTAQITDQPAPDQTGVGQSPPTTPHRYALTGRSAEIAAERVRTESLRALESVNHRPIVDALSIVEDTRRAQRALETSDLATARASLEQASDKADLIVSNRPSEALVPFSVDLRVIDSQPSDAKIKQVTDNTNQLIRNGRYQAARLLMKEVASEINITTSNIPLATFPPRLKQAATFIDQGKPKDALTEVSVALQGLAFVETAIPLPVIRAEALIDEANRLANLTPSNTGSAAASPSPNTGVSGAGANTSTNTPQIVENLLQDADRQLALAETLGYGSQKGDYSSLRQTIKSLQSNVVAKRESKGLFAKAKTSLSQIKFQTNK